MASNLRSRIEFKLFVFQTSASASVRAEVWYTRVPLTGLFSPRSHTTPGRSSPYFSLQGGAISRQLLAVRLEGTCMWQQHMQQAHANLRSGRLHSSLAIHGLARLELITWRYAIMTTFLSRRLPTQLELTSGQVLQRSAKHRFTTVLRLACDRIIALQVAADDLQVCSINMSPCAPETCSACCRRDGRLRREITARSEVYVRGAAAGTYGRWRSAFSRGQVGVGLCAMCRGLGKLETHFQPASLGGVS